MLMQELNGRVEQVSADRCLFISYMKILLHVVERLKIALFFFSIIRSPIQVLSIYGKRWEEVFLNHNVNCKTSKYA